MGLGRGSWRESRGKFALSEEVLGAVVLMASPSEFSAFDTL